MNLRNMLQAHIGQNVEVYFLNEVVEGTLLVAGSGVFEIEISGGSYTSPFTRAKIPYLAPSYVRVQV